LIVAAFPPADVRADLAQRVAGLRVTAAAGGGTRVRLTRDERRHITVAFLGDVPGERLPEVERAVQAAVRGHPGPAPRVRLAGGGCFGRGRSKVLWVGVTGDVGALAALRTAVCGGLAAAGLPCDERPFTPHLTVAFPGDRVEAATVEADRVALDGYRGPLWTVGSIVLVHSRLGAEAGYDVVRAWDLGGPAQD
jgi:2'-5' RNA ligase